jgi:hypothetical protein
VARDPPAVRDIRVHAVRLTPAVTWCRSSAGVTLFVERDGRVRREALVTAAHFVPLVGEHGFDEG